MAEDGTICVVDDDSGMRDSLRFLLEARGYAVQTFGSAKEFLKRGVGGVGCLIADVRMPDMTGLELQEHLARQGSRLRVIIITGHADVAMAVGAMKAGAVDFIEKPFDEDALIGSVEKALEQSRRLSTHGESSAALDGRLAALTAREREVLEHLVTGSPHKVIAHALDISPRTVEVHRARIMQKLGARNLAELVRLMLAAGSGRG